jgi:hypothetical protein
LEIVPGNFGLLYSPQAYAGPCHSLDRIVQRAISGNRVR